MSFDDDALLGIPIEDIIALAAAAFVAIIVIVIWRSTIERAPTQRAVKAISQRRDELRAELGQAQRRSTNTDAVDFARKTLNRFKLLSGNQFEAAAGKLLRAGIRSRDATTVFLFAKLCLPIAAVVFSVVFLHFLGLFDLQTTQSKLLSSVGLILFSFFLPDIMIQNLTAKRQALLTKAMPDMLDLLVICAEAGLALDNALVRVAKELRISSSEMADELELTSAELGFMADRRMAMNNLRKRTGLPAMQALVNTLVQSERYGTPLADALRVLSAELRDARLMKAEEKAARLPATMTVPMMIFIMPTLAIVLVGPAILNVIDQLLPTMAAAAGG
jgi:tight adherence protein C